MTATQATLALALLATSFAAGYSHGAASRSPRYADRCYDAECTIGYGGCERIRVEDVSGHRAVLATAACGVTP